MTDSICHFSLWRAVIETVALTSIEFCINPRKKVDHICILVRHWIDTSQKVVRFVLDLWFKSPYEPLRKLALIHVRTTKAQISCSLKLVFLCFLCFFFCFFFFFLFVCCFFFFFFFCFFFVSFFRWRSFTSLNEGQNDFLECISFSWNLSFQGYSALRSILASNYEKTKGSGQNTHLNDCNVKTCVIIVIYQRNWVLLVDYPPFSCKGDNFSVILFVFLPTRFKWGLF